MGGYTGGFDWGTRGAEVMAFAEQAIREHGVRGYKRRVASQFGITIVAVESGLADCPGWPERREAAQAKQAATPAPVDPTPPDDPGLRALERKLADARRENELLRRKLEEADSDKSVVEELAEVIRATVEPLPYVPFKPREFDGKGTPVDGAVALSDEHADEIIRPETTWGLETYDFDIFRCRLARWVHLTTNYATRWLPAHHFERLWIQKLGDSQHGDIHDHKYRNHFSNSIRAALAIGDAEAQAIGALVPHFPGGVHIVSVSGNHPRQTKRKDYDDPHDNLDFLVTTQIATRLARYIDAGQVTVNAPRAWTAFVEVRGKVHALNHGDDVRGTWGIPWYGFAKKEGRVQSLVGKKDVKISFYWYGHYHTDMAITENDVRSVHAGAFTFADGYSMNSVSKGQEPMQPFLVLDDARGRLLEVPLYLRDAEREAACRAGEYAPPYGLNVLETVGAADGLASRGSFPLIRAPQAS